MKPVFLYCSWVLLLSACSSKYAGDGPEQSTTGRLRYSSIAIDGAGLYYETKSFNPDSPPSASTIAGIVLLNDGKGGYIRDGETITRDFGKYLDKNTKLIYRYTGRNACFEGSTGVCYLQPVIDTVRFEIIP